MKWILKILAAPVAVFIAVFVWIAVQVLRLSSFLFALAETVVGILGLLTLITVSVKNGIILLIIAFLIGPHGVPMLLAWLIIKLKKVQYAVFAKIETEHWAPKK